MQVNKSIRRRCWREVREGVAVFCVDSNVTGVVSSSQLQSSSIPPSMEALYGACRHVKRK